MSLPWVHIALIVPAAHTRIFDSEYQHELYDAFHTGKMSRWAHALCTPLINVGLLALAAQAGIAATLVAIGFYLAVDRRLAFAMVPVLALAVVLAHALIAILGGHALDGTVAFIVIATLAQTWSHALEPLPPAWSGSHRRMSVGDFLRSSSVSRRIGFIAMVLFFYPLLELWAAPRIWPIQMADLFTRPQPQRPA
jgi:hypothetical protein